LRQFSNFGKKVQSAGKNVIENMAVVTEWRLAYASMHYTWWTEIAIKINSRQWVEKYT